MSITDWLKKLKELELKTETQVRPNWKIDKQFSFCYGHRVWSQQLVGDYCETGDTSCKCRRLHGHEGLVHVFLEADKLERGMVTDFKHLGWLKNFLDDAVDHKFIMDLNDPWFSQITNLRTYHVDKDHIRWFTPVTPLNTTDEIRMSAYPWYVPGTGLIAGWYLDVKKLQGPEQEFFESFFFVDFLPTSENLSRWLYECVKEKMSKINVKVTRVDWFETPKSRSSYGER